MDGSSQGHRRVKFIARFKVQIRISCIAFKRFLCFLFHRNRTNDPPHIQQKYKPFKPRLKPWGMLNWWSYVWSYIVHQLLGKRNNFSWNLANWIFDQNWKWGLYTGVSCLVTPYFIREVRIEIKQNVTLRWKYIAIRIPIDIYMIKK